jgi:hypothetical protein
MSIVCLESRRFGFGISSILAHMTIWKSLWAGGMSMEESLHP